MWQVNAIYWNPKRTLFANLSFQLFPFNFFLSNFFLSTFYFFLSPFNFFLKLIPKATDGEPALLTVGGPVGIAIAIVQVAAPGKS